MVRQMGRTGHRNILPQPGARSWVIVNFLGGNEIVPKAGYARDAVR